MSEVNAIDAWRAATVASPIMIDGRQVAIAVEPFDGGVRLRARLHDPEGIGRSPQLVAPTAMLSRLELSSRGDTRLAADAGGVVATRTILGAEPERSRAAAFELAGVVLAALEGATSCTDGHNARVAGDAVAPPVFVDSPDLLGMFDRYRAVDAPQPAWNAPDGSQPPTTELVPGTWYELLSEREAWASVRDASGLPVWTDGRTLVVASDRPINPDPTGETPWL